MKCPKCTNDLEPNALFCGACGEHININSNTNTESLDDKINSQSTNLTQFENQQYPNLITEQIQPQMPQQFPKSEDDKKVRNNKIKTAIVIAIIIIILGVIISIVINKISHKSNNIEQQVKTTFNEEQYIVIFENGKYGYINTDGKIVIEPKYDYAIDFVGDYGLVAEKGESSEYIYSLIDKNENVKIQKNGYLNSIEFMTEYNVWYIDGELYDAKLNRISPEKTMVGGYSLYDTNEYLSWSNEKSGGIITPAGKITYEVALSESSYVSVKYPEISRYMSTKYCVVSANDKYAVVNCDTGKVVYDYQNNFISVEDNNIFEVNDDQYDPILKFYVQNDKIIYQTTDDNIEIDYYNGSIEITDKNKSSNEEGYEKYIDLKTGEIVSKKPATEDIEILNAWELATGYTIYQDEKTYYYGIKEDDKIIVNADKYDKIENLDPISYEYLSDKGKNLVIVGVEVDEYSYPTIYNYSVLDIKNGKVSKNFKTNDLDIEDNSTFITYKNLENQKNVIYNLLTGKSLETDKSVNLYASHVELEKDDIKEYYNTDLKLIYTQNDN